jgi:putative SOS response-associated peptidase YedK
MEVAIECANRAMPVILAGEARSAWLSAPIEEALALQRPAPDDLLRTVTGGDKTGDPAQTPAAGRLL